MNYTSVRDQIYTELAAVSGIGKVFKSKRLVEEWAPFLARFVINSRINVTWFTETSANEQWDSQLAENTDSDVIQYTERAESWQIETFYGFDDADDADSPSEFAFQTLCEAIEAKFRFSQTLSATVDKVFPMRRVSSGLFVFSGGDVKVHRAEFQLTLRYRIANPAADS